MNTLPQSWDHLPKWWIESLPELWSLPILWTSFAKEPYKIAKEPYKIKNDVMNCLSKWWIESLPKLWSLRILLVSFAKEPYKMTNLLKLLSGLPKSKMKSLFKWWIESLPE